MAKNVSPENSSGPSTLAELTVEQLKKYATLYKIPFNKDSSKEELIVLIENKNKNKQLSVAMDTSKAPAPGRTRIVIQKDASLGPKAGNRAVPVFVNGYRADIPRGVPCDVPHKVVDLLQNCMHPQTVIDENDPQGASKVELLPSYPFNILASTEGPDPAPGFEKVKAKTHRPREVFYQLFGYWPHKAALREAIKEGLISLKDDEKIMLEPSDLKE